MASIVKFYQLWESRDDLSLNDVSGTATFRAVFDTNTSDWMNISPSDALDHPDCPKRWSSVHPNFPFAICTNLSPVRSADMPHAIDITVTYETLKSDGVDSKGKPLEENPIKRPLSVEWQTWTLRKPILTWIPPATRPTLDYVTLQPVLPFAIGTQSEPFLNTAGDRILMEEEHSNRALSCSKYVKKMDPIFATGGDWVNSDSVTIEGFKFEKHTLWASNINFGKTEVVNGYLVKLMSFTLRHNPETWFLRVDNLGYNHISYRSVAGANQKLDLVLAHGPIKTQSPPENTSQPLPLLNLPARIQAVGPVGSPQPPAQAAAFPSSQYNMAPTWGPSTLGTINAAGVTNGDFTHGHVHPAFSDFNDKGEPIAGKNLTPTAISQIYAEHRLYGLTRPLISFNQYLPLA